MFFQALEANMAWGNVEFLEISRLTMCFNLYGNGEKFFLAEVVRVLDFPYILRPLFRPNYLKETFIRPSNLDGQSSKDGSNEVRGAADFIVV